MKKNITVPQDIVCEFLGQFELQGNEEQQVSIAEQIASQYYSDLDQLAQTIEGYSPSKRKFSKSLSECKKSSFFKEYWKEPMGVKKSMVNSEKEDCI